MLDTSMEQALMDAVRYRLDPVLWGREHVEAKLRGKLVPYAAEPWQAKVLWTPGDQILCCARQTGKSTTVSVLAAHELIFKPGAFVVIISKTEKQAVELFDKIQGHLKGLAPSVILTKDTYKEARLSNGSRIIAVAGDGDNARGFSGPTMVIIDEAAFCVDDIYHAVDPMLAASGGRMILLSTPEAQQGFFFETWFNGGDNWTRSRVSYLESSIVDHERVERKRRELPAYRFKTEYLAEFAAGDDAVFLREDVDGLFTGDFPQFEFLRSA